MAEAPSGINFEPKLPTPTPNVKKTEQAKVTAASQVTTKEPSRVESTPKPKRNKAVPLKGFARAAAPLLAVGVTFGVAGAVDQGGLRPITVSAAGETPTRTPTPTPDAVRTTTANQMATNTAEAKSVSGTATARSGQATTEAGLHQSQDQFNSLQQTRAALQNPILSPLEAATATQAARQASTDATREALANRAKVESATQVAATSTAAATATEGRKQDEAQATAVATAAAGRTAAIEKARNAVDWGKRLWGTLWTTLGLGVLTSVVVSRLRRNTWGKLQDGAKRIWNS